MNYYKDLKFEFIGHVLDLFITSTSQTSKRRPKAINSCLRRYLPNAFKTAPTTLRACKKSHKKLTINLLQHQTHSTGETKYEHHKQSKSPCKHTR